ncbi:MAG: hypothetical protein WCA96_11590 [Methylocella sp.]
MIRRMRGPDTVRAKTRVLLCLVFLAASASQVRAANDSGSIKLRKLPPVAINVAAFPRLVAGADPAIVKRINKLLARGDGRVRNAARDCLRMGRKRADWSRKVSVTMQGPRYLSFVASDDYYCGGAYPDTSTVALVFDLNTGGLVDWAKLLPELAQRTGADTAGDGSTLGTVSSGRLSDLYRDLAKRGGGVPECVDSLKETEMNFLLWPDTKQDGLVVQPDLAHVIAACGPALPIPLQTLRSLGVNAEFVKAIDAAHRQGGG